jgi:hypothetical protein
MGQQRDPETGNRTSTGGQPQDSGGAKPSPADSGSQPSQPADSGSQGGSTGGGSTSSR